MNNAFRSIICAITKTYRWVMEFSFTKILVRGLVPAYGVSRVDGGGCCETA